MLTIKRLIYVKPTEHEIAVNDYLKTLGIIYNAQLLGETKRNEWVCDEWRVTFNRGDKKESFEYFTGTGHRVSKVPVPAFVGLNPRSIATARWVKENVKPHTPQAAGVLYSLLTDISATEQSFADWCADFGYDTDSRKALTTYEACQKNADKLFKLFTPEERAHLSELLEDY